jgi:hypothetical protein
MQGAQAGQITEQQQLFLCSFSLAAAHGVGLQPVQVGLQPCNSLSTLVLV